MTPTYKSVGGKRNKVAILNKTLARNKHDYVKNKQANSHTTQQQRGREVIVRIRNTKDREKDDKKTHTKQQLDNFEAIHASTHMTKANKITDKIHTQGWRTSFRPFKPPRQPSYPSLDGYYSNANTLSRTKRSHTK